MYPALRVEVIVPPVNPPPVATEVTPETTELEAAPIKVLIAEGLLQ